MVLINHRDKEKKKFNNKTLNLFNSVVQNHLRALGIHAALDYLQSDESTVPVVNNEMVFANV